MGAGWLHPNLTAWGKRIGRTPGRSLLLPHAPRDRGYHHGQQKQRRADALGVEGGRHQLSCRDDAPGEPQGAGEDADGGVEGMWGRASHG